MKKFYFITGTDTGVGKTIATAVLGALLQARGYDVGVMKPVQCGGNDARFLKRFLNIFDPLEKINPCFAKEPLSPHLAFSRQRKTVDVPKIIQAFQELQSRHDIVLIEGAGGLLVPLKENYFVLDLIKDLEAEVIIISRLGLGSINHTLLTINQARDAGLKIKGILFNTLKSGAPGIPEKTNPEIIERLGNVPVLGTIPFISDFNRRKFSTLTSGWPEGGFPAARRSRGRQGAAGDSLPAGRQGPAGIGFKQLKIVKRCAGKINLGPFLSEEKEENIFHWEAWDKKYLWHPFTQMKDWLQDDPLVIEEAKGCYLKDTQGNWYLDGVSSLWVNVHGHRKKEIDEELKKQINRLGHSTFLGLSNTPAIELAKKLIEIAPPGLEKVFYSDNGSTAVEVALKMAYQYWQNTGRTKKTKLVHLNNSYQGDTLGSVSVGGIDLFHKVYRELIFETIAVEFPDFYRAPAREKYPAYTEECFQKLEKIFQSNHQALAALIVEPLVQGAAGMVVWPPGLLKRIAGLCRRFDVLLIADEVATGFGRTGTMFACEHENVRPDFLCLAKGLSGGYLPLAATLTTRRIFEGFLFDYKDQKTFFHGHTYTGNPLACAAALANLRIFEKEQTLRTLQSKIKYLAKGLKKFYNLASVGDVRQKGLMVGIELVKNRSTKEPFAWEERIGARVCQEARLPVSVKIGGQVRKHGVILRPLGNVIVLMPPLAISLEEIDRLLEATYGAIEKVVIA